MSKVDRMSTNSTDKVSVSKTLSMICHLAVCLKFQLKVQSRGLLIVPNPYDLLSFEEQKRRSLA